MPITPTEKIWMNGELVPWEDAKIHILTHTLHYGMGVFEGIRAYETDDGPGIFRLTDHIERLFRSAAILGMEMPYTVAELVQATKDTVASTGLAAACIVLTVRMARRRAFLAAVLNAAAALVFLAPVNPAWMSIQVAVNGLVAFSWTTAVAVWLLRSGPPNGIGGRERSRA